MHAGTRHGKSDVLATALARLHCKDKQETGHFLLHAVLTGDSLVGIT